MLAAPATSAKGAPGWPGTGCEHVQATRFPWPTELSDELLSEIVDVAQRYWDRVDLAKMISRSVWRKGMETVEDRITELPDGPFDGPCTGHFQSRHPCVRIAGLRSRSAAISATRSCQRRSSAAVGARS